MTVNGYTPHVVMLTDGTTVTVLERCGRIHFNQHGVIGQESRKLIDTQIDRKKKT
jgi:hypothetical protein